MATCKLLPRDIAAWSAVCTPVSTERYTFTNLLKPFSEEISAILTGSVVTLDGRSYCKTETGCLLSLFVEQFKYSLDTEIFI